MQLSIIAMAPSLATALALPAGSLCGTQNVLGSGKSTLQTQCFKQNCSYFYDIGPSPAPFANFEVFLPVAIGPWINVSVPSCGVGNHHREAELGYVKNRDADTTNMFGVQSKTSTFSAFLVSTY